MKLKNKEFGSSKDMNKFFQKIYLWMFLGLVISGITAFVVSNSPSIIEFIFGTPLVFILIIIAELALVFILVGIIKKLSSTLALMMFLLYSLLSGLTFSAIFLAYDIVTINITFFITALTFVTMCVYGLFTKKDLTSLGQLFFMGLIGIIIALIVNFFLASSTLDYIISFIAVIIFVGLTAYDSQKIKKDYRSGYGVSEAGKKYSVIAALSLYLDFINLFLSLLRIFGRD